MKKVYKKWIRKVPLLHRLRRRYSNFDLVAGLSAVCFLCGFVIGMAAAIDAHRDPLKALVQGKNRLGLVDWLHRNFADVVVVPGLQKDGTFVLADFESVADFSLWKTEASHLEVSSEYASEGTHSMKMLFHHHTRLSSALMERYFNSRYAQSDWSGYRALAFYIYNPQETRERIILQIKDRRGKRYKQDLVMDPERGTNFVIDIEGIRREIDIHRIEHINFFAWDATVNREFYLDHLRLLPLKEKN